MPAYDLKAILEARCPEKLAAIPAWLRGSALAFLHRLLIVDEANWCIDGHPGLSGAELIRFLFDRYNFHYDCPQEDMDRIPRTGRLIVVSNHPLGGLDGLALLEALRTVRPDARAIVNDLLMNIPQLRDYFLPIDAFGKPGAESMKAINRAIENEEALLIFPAGEVSRPGPDGVKDGEWSHSPLHFARKFDAPILPVHMDGRNSRLFYLLARLNKNLSMLMLPREMLNRRPKSLRITVGNPIPASSIQPRIFKKRQEAAALRRHVYNLAAGGEGVFRTVETVVPADAPEVFEAELARARCLGQVGGRYSIYMFTQAEAPRLLREIGRLRELTFRIVGEGTGKAVDLDDFDPLYQHLILWNDEKREVVGAYRLGICKDIVNAHGLAGLYTASLFNYSADFDRFWPEAIECGRTFVREEYWNTRALDFLWQGIGAFLAERPDIRYLFGGVSISNRYPAEAKDLIVYFYTKWFKDGYEIATGKSPYRLTDQRVAELRQLFHSEMFGDDLRVFKDQLKHLGVRVPILYRLYADLCEDEGLHFLAFSVDKDFENCIDGLILVDTSKVKERRRNSYRKPIPSEAPAPDSAA